ncbi:metallophosphoesterase [bacterium]|nr:metallophosphoesterase [bacterium]
MRIAFIADIHSNLPALEAVLADIKKESCDIIYFAGDAVGYGPWPAETISLLMSQNLVGIVGNHDTGVVGSSSLRGYYDAARYVIEWTRQQLSAAQFEWLSSLSYTKTPYEWLLLSHGSPDYPQEFRYVATAHDVELLQHSHLKLPHLTVVGHSHLQRLFLMTSGKRALELSVDEESGISLDKNAPYFCIAGSVGQPRDGDTRAAWSLYDREEGQFYFKRVEYDISLVQKEIERKGLPRNFGVRLAEGY